jgi:hypothetical protein
MIRTFMDTISRYRTYIYYLVQCDYYNRDIYRYNCMTHEEEPVITNSSDQGNFAVYEGVLVWSDNRNGTRTIFCHYLHGTPPPWKPTGWNLLLYYKWYLVCALYVRNVSFNMCAYVLKRKKGFCYPVERALILILVSFPVFDRLFKNKNE